MSRCARWIGVVEWRRRTPNKWLDKVIAEAEESEHHLRLQRKLSSRRLQLRGGSNLSKPYKSTATVSSNGEEKDVGALIDRERQLLRKAKAATVLPKQNTTSSAMDHRIVALPAAPGCNNTKRKQQPSSIEGKKLKRKRLERRESVVCHKARRRRSWKQYRKIYSAEGCTNQVHSGWICIRHGSKVKLCSSEKCSNQALRGGLCVRHGAKRKRCSSEGCTNQSKTGGVCVRHGAQVKRCCSGGCTNPAQKGGVCRRHAYRSLGICWISSEGSRVNPI